MAATVSSSPSPWGKPGSWALDAEEHEAELQQQNENPSEENDAAYPPLTAASKQSKKKKKQQTLTLSEFNNSKAFSSPRAHDEVLNLPTGPRQRSSDEEFDRNRIGGGFRSYGNPRGPRGEDSMSNSRASRFPDREGGRDREREFVPSRADEVDDWSKGKKASFGSGFERRERPGGASFFDGQVSKADQSDNWAAGKVAVEPRRFGGGFERRGGFDSLPRESRGGADSDSWGRRKEESNGTEGGVRPRLVLRPRTLPVTGEETAAKPKGSSPFGEARPREEVLADKGKDWKEIDEKLESVKLGNGKESERGDRRDSYGWRRERGGLRSEVAADERSWRKSDAVVDSRSQSAGSAESSPALRNVNSSEDGLSETN